MYTIIKSELFANVEFNVCRNSYNVQLTDSTNVFEGNKPYAISDLFESGSHLANVLQWEGVKVGNVQTEQQFFAALINDMLYSESCFMTSYKKFEDLQGIASLVKVKYCYKVNREELHFYAYGFNTLQAEKMFNLFVQLKRYQLEKVNKNNLYTTKNIYIEPKAFYSKYLAKDVFYIPDHNKQDTPFEDLDFYQWLTDQGINDHHTINTRKQYLDHLGFNKETHRLLPESLSILKYCLQYHFEQNFVK